MSKWCDIRADVCQASRRNEPMNNRKTGQDLAPYLKLCIWGRAEEPGKLEHILAGSQIWRIPLDFRWPPRVCR